MAFLRPRLQGQKAAGHLRGLGLIPLFQLADELGAGVDSQLVQMLPGNRLPFPQLLGVSWVEGGEKLPGIELQGSRPCPFAHPLLKQIGVQAVGRVGAEQDRLPGDGEIAVGHVPVAKDPANLVEGLAKILTDFGRALLGPEQSSQLFPAVGRAPVTHEIDQKRRRLAHFEGNRTTVKCNL